MNLEKFRAERDAEREVLVDDAEQRFAFVRSLTRFYERRASGALEDVRSVHHPGHSRNGESSYQLHEHVKMLRRELLELDKLLMRL